MRILASEDREDEKKKRGDDMEKSIPMNIESSSCAVYLF
jgi:hypothetical protein